MPARASGHLQIGSIGVRQAIDAVAVVNPLALWSSAVRATGGTKGGETDDWTGHASLLRSDGQLEMPVGAFTCRTGSRIALIDLGYGPTPPAPLEGGLLLESLAAQGLAPADVTDVIFSHLHPDHVGWATVDGRATFPSADYFCHTDDWEYFVAGAAVPEVADLVAPLADRMHMWTGSHQVAPGIDLVAAPGHTPGNAYVVISSGSARAFLLGDIVHCPVELVDDDWAGLGDVDPALALRVRRALARELEGSDAVAAGAHFPGMSFGRLLVGQGSRSWRWS